MAPPALGRGVWGSTMGDDRSRVALAICTYRRNDLLARLLDALLVCAARVADRAAIGVALIDDTADGQARAVADAYAGRFELGLDYRISGKQNISHARNLAIATALAMGEGGSDWIAMTDDDCEPPPHWLDALLDVQRATGADAVTGRIHRRVPEGSPRWITEQPFLELGQEELADAAPMTSAATFDTLISGAWLRAHPDIRFDPAFGAVGGEDMVFFRAAHAAGLQVRYSQRGFVYENEPADRATFGYQLYVHLWHGNSSCLAMVDAGVSRARLLAHAFASMGRAVARPLGRLGRGQPPQLRYGLALSLHALGKLLGPLGVRIAHR